MASRIRRGDNVVVTTGKNKGARGRVSRVLRGKDRVFVRGVNLVKRHVRPTQKDPQGGIQEREAALHVSNVMLLDPEDDRPCRVKVVEREGRRIRVSKRTGAEIPEITELPDDT